MMRQLRKWFPLVLVLATLTVGAMGAATYNGLDELPEPDLVVSDRTGDAVYSCAASAPIGWYDLKEIEVFITDDGIAFAVFCHGSVPSDKVLFIFLDVDGQVGSVGRAGVTLERAITAGYEYAIGIHGGQVGVFDMSYTFPQRCDPDLEWWKERQAAYFEVTWDQIGGRPEAVSLLAFTTDSYEWRQAANAQVVIWDLIWDWPEETTILPFAINYYGCVARDHAPDQGKATLEIPLPQ